MIDQFLDWYNGINQNRAQGVYSPHKPLTILFMLSKILRSNERYIDYNQDRDDLEKLIWSFTNKQSRPNCLQPLYRLFNDNRDVAVWEVAPKNINLNQAGDVPTGFARDNQFKAGFSEKFHQWFKNNRASTQQIIKYLMDDNLAETRIGEALIGLHLNELEPEVTESPLEQVTRKRRDPNFRPLVLSAYDNKCCFCGLNIKLNFNPVNMEAAHIKMKSQGGACDIKNGLALCPTHHSTFDRGIWTLNQDNLEIELSPRVTIDERSDIFFRPYEGKSIEDKIVDKSLLPDPKNIIWHRKNLFVS